MADNRRPDPSFPCFVHARNRDEPEGKRRGPMPTDGPDLLPPPVINVGELLAQVRVELACRHARHAAVRETCEPAPAINWSPLSASLSQAEQYAPLHTTVPVLARFRGLKRQLARLVARCVLYLARVVTSRQSHFNLEALNSLRHVQTALRDLEASNLEQHLQTRTNLRQLDAVVQLQQQTLDEQQTRLERHHTTLDEHDRSLQDQQAHLHDLEQTVEHLKTQLVLQEHRVSLFLEEARRRLPGPFHAEQLHFFASEEDHALDALWASLEDELRGSRGDMRERLRTYVPLLCEAACGAEILDLGCGRGDWLEVLLEAGLRARGIDRNRALVAQARARGLPVQEAEALTHLRGLPDASLGAVTGLHLVEHLRLEDLIRLLDETVRVLRRGGLALFETPNPHNPLVGSCYFYLDPTHRNPLPRPTLKFLVEARGLCRVAVLPPGLPAASAHRAGSDRPVAGGGPEAEPLAYAVIGYKV
jgi:O-antigen chain-terminating methyltransferase